MTEQNEALEAMPIESGTTERNLTTELAMARPILSGSTDLALPKLTALDETYLPEPN